MVVAVWPTRPGLRPADQTAASQYSMEGWRAKNNLSVPACSVSDFTSQMILVGSNRFPEHVRGEEVYGLCCCHNAPTYLKR